MTLADDIAGRLAGLNDELRDEGDRARIRFMHIEPDPDFDGEWLVLATWEVPEATAVSDVRQLDQYCSRLADQLEDLAITECLFRTSAEIEEVDQLGSRLPEPAASA